MVILSFEIDSIDYANKIKNFYHENPKELFAQLNIMLIDMVSATQNKNDPDINSINNIKLELENVKNNIIYELKEQINKPSVDIHSLLEKTHNSLIDKTALLMNNVLPKNNNYLSNIISENIHNVKKDIESNISAISNDQNSINRFINNFDMKLSIMIQNLQQPFFTTLNKMEDNINKNINDIQKIFNNNNNFVSDDIANIIANKIIDKTSRSNSRSNSPDNSLSRFISNIYPSSQVNKFKNLDTMVLFKRQYKPIVSINSIDKLDNISQDEIEDFLQLIDDERCHGILLSQSSGISCKNNFEIELHNNNIIVYVHNCDFDDDKLRIAVNIIDQLSIKLNFIKSSIQHKELTIPRDVMDTINNEFHSFLSQKNAMIEVLKENQKRAIAQLDEIKLPSLDKYLSQHYIIPISKPGIKCDICRSYTANNLKALAAHKRGCIRKNKAE